MIWIYSYRNIQTSRIGTISHRDSSWYFLGVRRYSSGGPKGKCSDHIAQVLLTLCWIAMVGKRLNLYCANSPSYWQRHGGTVHEQGKTVKHSETRWVVYWYSNDTPQWNNPLVPGDQKHVVCSKNSVPIVRTTILARFGQKGLERLWSEPVPHVPCFDLTSAKGLCGCTDAKAGALLLGQFWAVSLRAC